MSYTTQLSGSTFHSGELYNATEWWYFHSCELNNITEWWYFHSRELYNTTELTHELSDVWIFLKKNLSASRPSEHPPVRAGKMSKRLGGIIGCKYKTIQRIVLATEETTVTQQVSHRPIKCQSRLWSQRGTVLQVNGSHHGDNPLLRPTGIQIKTKSYATQQVMAPTNVKTVHQISLLHIESNLDRLGLLSPTHDQRSQQQSGQIMLQPVLITKSNTHHIKIRKIEISRYMAVVEALSWRSRRASQHPAVQGHAHIPLYFSL